MQLSSEEIRRLMEFIDLISAPNLISLSLSLTDFMIWLRTPETTKEDLQAAKEAFIECELYEQVVLIDLVLYENN